MPNHFIRGKYREEDRVIGPSLDAIERVYDAVLAMGDRDVATFFTMKDHEAAWRQRSFDVACKHLFWDTFNWLKIFFYTTAFKARHLAEALVGSYNSDNHLTWLILVRSSLEYAAVSHHFARKIRQIQLDGPHYELSQLKTLEDLMLQYSHGSRFNWSALIAGDLNLLRTHVDASSAKAIHVQTALRTLARRGGGHADVEIAYEMLSDFAHPRMASHVTVIDMPGKPGPQRQVSLAVNPEPLRGEFIAVVSLPWAATALETMLDVLIGLAPVMERWLRHEDDGSTISIDLTK